MSLNPCQEEAARGFFNFMMSPQKEFSISGPAGTGKTFLMEHLLTQTLSEVRHAYQLLDETPPRYEVVLCATTNKAAEVLSKATGREALTIYTFMNLKVYDDYKTGISKISKTSSWKVHSRKLIFLDEASMTDSTLYEYIKAGTDDSCKIVYLGDHCQMAPVFENISPIYRNPQHYAYLKQPMRNAGQPALVQLCSQLRQTVETLKFQPIDPVPGVIEYLEPTQAEAFINSTFHVEGSDARVLCYTNNRVQSYNQHIRNLRGYPETLSKGERVINNNSGVIIGTKLLRVEEEFIVKDVLSAPYATEIEPGVTMMVYELLLSSPGGTEELTVKVPEEPDHLKALMKYYAAQKNWHVFYGLKNAYPDLRPKDASTVYKAQGSTYETVFLDLHNIGSCTQSDQLARMLYVGASRATTRLMLFGNLPSRLFKQAA